MSSITTKRGDDGTADACTERGVRLAKDDAVFDALGTVDELQCTIGVARCHLRRDSVTFPEDGINLDNVLESMQKVLSCTVCVSLLPSCFLADGKADLLRKTLEEETAKGEGIAKAMALGSLREFVVPGASGCLTSAQLHVCRTVCRRAERTVVHAVSGNGSLATVIPPALKKALLTYMNRSSDLLFSCALYVEKYYKEK